MTALPTGTSTSNVKAINTGSPDSRHPAVIVCAARREVYESAPIYACILLPGGVCSSTWGRGGAIRKQLKLGRDAGSGMARTSQRGGSVPLISIR